MFDAGEGQPTDIATLDGKSLKAFRRKAQMIFQDPYESMNPRLTIFDTVSEPLRVQNIGGPLERLDRATQMLEQVGLTPPRTFLFRYPYELSGGQRQRVAIARALIIEPTFVVADEPTSMLDVSIRTSIMRLMQDLAGRLGVSYLYITHDLAVARYMCNRIAVMYLGKDSRDRRDRGDTPASKASLYQGSPIGRAGSRSNGQAPPGQHKGRRVHARGSAGPLPILRPLPHSRRPLPRQSPSPARRKSTRPDRCLLQSLTP